MNIRSALAALRTLEAGLAITSPVVASIKRAYLYMPNQATVAPDAPCVMNDWSLTGIERVGGIRIQKYAVHIQLFVDDSDQDQAADIATAFQVAFVDALDGATSLSGTVVMADLRGGSPTLALLERAGRAYIGLDLFLDLTLKEGKAFSA